MKYRAILYVISLLLIFLSFGMGISSAVSFIMSDPDALVYRFSGCAAWTFIIGYALCKLTERKRGELDSLPELQAFADRLEKATLDTINDGIMTKDLALLYEGDAKAVNSREFLAEIRKRIQE